MFITENQNVGDSVLFLLSSREALANIVEQTGSENADELISFIYNEASDYEIMHLLINGSLPEDRYDAVAEMLLFSDLKESMLMNKDFVEEMVGEELFYNILNEVDSLYMEYSTAAPVLEFAASQDLELGLAWFISEAGAGSKIAAGIKSKAAAAKAAKLKAAAAASPTFKAAKASWSPEKVKALKAKAVAAKQKQLAATTAGRMKGGAGAPSTYSRYKGMAGKKVAAGKAAVQGFWQKATAGAKTPMIQKAKGVTVPGKAGTGAKLKAAGKYVAKTYPGATKAAAVTGGAAGAALAIYAGAKIYKRFFSQAAKACGGQSGAAKTQCMNKYKKQAIMKQAAAIQSASGTCAKSKNPEKCKAGVATKVQSLKAKAANIAA